jgi:hypothetical protein
MNDRDKLGGAHDQADELHSLIQGHVMIELWLG